MTPQDERPRDNLREANDLREERDRYKAALEELEKEHNRLTYELEKSRDSHMKRSCLYRTALESIVSHSYSWLITQETGRIEKPIHDSYREIARQALEGK